MTYIRAYPNMKSFMKTVLMNPEEFKQFKESSQLALYSSNAKLDYFYYALTFTFMMIPVCLIGFQLTKKYGVSFALLLRIALSLPNTYVQFVVSQDVYWSAVCYCIWLGSFITRRSVFYYPLKFAHFVFKNVHQRSSLKKTSVSANIFISTPLFFLIHCFVQNGFTFVFAFQCATLLISDFIACNIPISWLGWFLLAFLFPLTFVERAAMIAFLINTLICSGATYVLERRREEGLLRRTIQNLRVHLENLNADYEELEDQLEELRQNPFELLRGGNP